MAVGTDEGVRSEAAPEEGHGGEGVVADRLRQLPPTPAARRHPLTGVHKESSQEDFPIVKMFSRRSNALHQITAVWVGRRPGHQIDPPSLAAMTDRCERSHHLAQYYPQFAAIAAERFLLFLER